MEMSDFTFNNEQKMNGNDKISLHLIMNRK